MIDVERLFNVALMLCGLVLILGGWAIIQYYRRTPNKWDHVP